ncbi:type II toxin-antitoxin system CcdA family antitoxin [Phenylobacterium sp.]|uniref:type II toxin-antitoxin system CcdA family antitoxin n=1 Tax=Phenylobacterium sp. TaxID=1871053 RepID=UPI00286B1208|nr:type II toxin-antitoxin system CcdA family antitoxin [Phenylobacterium sp.]
MGKGELKIDPVLLAEAEAVGVAASRVAEDAIRRAMLQRMSPAETEARAARWAAENAEAIQAHRERIERYGVFGEDLRTW